MSESLNLGGGENVPGIPDACATRNFTYLARGPWEDSFCYTLCVQYNEFIKLGVRGYLFQANDKDNEAIW